VEKYHPSLVGALTPVVSPMVATARYIRESRGRDPKLVFIGPCIAKKDESDEVDVVITFAELRQLFTSGRIRPSNVKSGFFTPPLAKKGAGFPVSRGLLQAMSLEGTFINFCTLFANYGTVSTCDATIGQYFGLTVDDADGFYGAFPHAGITDPAQILYRIYQWSFFCLLHLKKYFT